MKSAVRQIYDKELGYRETEREDKEYRKGRDKYNKAYETLEATLNREQKQMLEELFVCESEVEGALEYLSFKDGFCAGVRLAFELCEDEK